MKKKTVLITGILGQDGPYLAKLLLEKGYRVYGMVRRYSCPNYSNPDFLNITNEIEYVEGDLTDEASLLNLIKGLQPDEVYNLAAQSFVGASFDQAKLTTEVNAIGVLHLLNAIKYFSPTSRFYQASTSEMFGLGNTNGIQDESTEFYPRSPYAISKLYAYWMTVNYREAYNLYTCNGILFNHESPIRGIQFVTRKITDGVAKIKLGLENKIRLGNLKARRDWGHAGDFVIAMHQMLQHANPSDYVIATGVSHSVEDFVRLAFQHVGIDNWKDYITLDPRFNRPTEVPDLRGRPGKAKKMLGWEPKITFEELVQVMVEEDLKRLEKKHSLKVKLSPSLV